MDEGEIHVAEAFFSSSRPRPARRRGEGCGELAVGTRPLGPAPLHLLEDDVAVARDSEWVARDADETHPDPLDEAEHVHDLARLAAVDTASSTSSRRNHAQIAVAGFCRVDEHRGVPQLASVAAIFRPTRPDLPMRGR